MIYIIDMVDMAVDMRAARSTRLIDAYGFEYADIVSIRTCFDVLAVKRDEKLILKFAENINSVTSNEAVALKKLRDFLGASVLIIASRGGGDRLYDTSSFTRKGITCLSSKAFEDYLNNINIPKAHKFIRNRRRIDSSKLVQERRISGLSIRKLSNALGISKDSLSRYERSNAYVKDSTLKKLEKFFSTDLSIAEHEQEHDVAAPANSWHISRDKQLFLGIFDRFIDNTPPFTVLAEKSIRYEVGTANDSRAIKRLAAAYGEIGKVLSTDRQFIISGLTHGKPSLHGVPILTRRESELRDESQLLELIESR
ncbi:transcriptional regulator, XRE family, partial [mine drainage metagenome]